MLILSSYDIAYFNKALTPFTMHKIIIIINISKAFNTVNIIPNDVYKTEMSNF